MSCSKSATAVWCIIVFNLIFAYKGDYRTGKSASAAVQAGDKGEREIEYSSVLDLIKNLEGEWTGTYEWSGIRTGKGTIRAKYDLTGYGSTVIENLIDDDESISMTSVYHMDGPSLRMTHYCAANNQPRLKATGFGDDNHFVEFEMIDITNLKNEKAGHVHGVKLNFLDANNIIINFKWIQDDKESLEIIELSKVKLQQP